MDLKENKVVIFKNKNKTNDNQPGYKGTANVDGKMYEISLWVRESSDGNKFFSGEIKEPYTKPESKLPDNDPEKIKKVNKNADSLPF